MAEEKLHTPLHVAERVRGIAEALTDGIIIIDGEEYYIPDHVFFKLELEERFDDGASEFEIEVEIIWPLPSNENIEDDIGKIDDTEWVLYYEAQLMTREAAAKRVLQLSTQVWGEHFELGGHEIVLPPQLTIDVETEAIIDDADENDGEVPTKLEIEIGWTSWQLMRPSAIAAKAAALQ